VFTSSDYTDVNCVIRSNNGKLLATGDDFGKVTLLKYPSTLPRTKMRKEFGGHSSHITRLRFSSDDSYLYSTGGGDKCVIVWDTDFGI